MEEFEFTPDANKLHDDIDNILATLRESPAPESPQTVNVEAAPSTIDTSKILEGVVAYVEVRSKHENRSQAIKHELEHLGATVEDKITPEVTHVVFKEGNKSTRTKALKQGKHLVSVLWVDSCKRNGTKVNESLFPVSDPNENKGTPVLFPRFKKTKSMQPKDFDDEVASSAERGVKKRKRLANNVRFQMLKTPKAGTPVINPRFFVAETQPRSPFEFDSPYSPSLTVPETPPSMRAKLEQLKRAQHNDSANDGDVDSPLPSTMFMDKLQKKLFGSDGNSSSTLESSIEGSPRIASPLSSPGPSSSKATANVPKSPVFSLSRGSSVSKESIPEIFAFDKASGKSAPSRSSSIKSPPVPKRKRSSVTYTNVDSTVRSRGSSPVVKSPRRNKRSSIVTKGIDTETQDSASTPTSSPVVKNARKNKRSSIVTKEIDAETRDGASTPTLSPVVKNTRKSKRSSIVTKEIDTETQDSASTPTRSPVVKNTRKSKRSSIVTSNIATVTQDSASPTRSPVVNNPRKNKRSSIVTKDIDTESQDTASTPTRSPVVNNPRKNKRSSIVNKDIDTDEDPLSALKDTSLESDTSLKSKPTTARKRKLMKNCDPVDPPSLIVPNKSSGCVQTKESVFTKTSDKAKKHERKNSGNKRSSNTDASDVRKRKSDGRDSSNTTSIVQNSKRRKINVDKTNVSVDNISVIVDTCTSDEHSQSPIMKKKRGRRSMAVTFGNLPESATVTKSTPIKTTRRKSVAVMQHRDEESDNFVSQSSNTKSRRKSTRFELPPQSQISATSEDNTGNNSTLKSKSEIKSRRRSSRPSTIVCSKATDSLNASFELSQSETQSTADQNKSSVTKPNGATKASVSIFGSPKANKSVSEAAKNDTTSKTPKSTNKRRSMRFLTPQIEPKDSQSQFDTDTVPDIATPTVAHASARTKCVASLSVATPSPSISKLTPGKKSTASIKRKPPPPNALDFLDQSSICEDNESLASTMYPSLSSSSVGSWATQRRSRRSTHDFTLAETGKLVINNPKTKSTKKKQDICSDNSSRLRNTSGQNSSSSEGETRGKKKWKKVKIVGPSDSQPSSKTLVMTSLHSDEQEMVTSVVKRLGGFKIAQCVTDSTTHIVSGGNRRTLNILHGISHGCWIVSLEWVFKSLEASKWIDEEPYEQAEFFPAAQISRLERDRSCTDSYRQTLFEDVGTVYVAENSIPPKAHLEKLLQQSGATIVASVRNADVCIGKIIKPDLRSVSEQWLLDSITSHRCLPFDRYQLNVPKRDQRAPSPSY